MTPHCWFLDEAESTWQHKPPRADYVWICAACEAVGTGTFHDLKPKPENVKPQRVFVETKGTLRLVPPEFAEDCKMTVIHAVHDL